MKKTLLLCLALLLAAPAFGANHGKKFHHIAQHHPKNPHIQKHKAHKHHGH